MARPPKFQPVKSRGQWRIYIPAKYSDSGKATRLAFRTKDEAKDCARKWRERVNDHGEDELIPAVRIGKGAEVLDLDVERLARLNPPMDEVIERLELLVGDLRAEFGDACFVAGQLGGWNIEGGDVPKTDTEK